MNDDSLWQDAKALKEKAKVEINKQVRGSTSSTLLYCPCCGSDISIFPHHLQGLRRGTMHTLSRDCGSCGQVMKYKYSKFKGLHITVEGYKIEVM